ncbi:MAG: phosphotransferase [Candidatus Andersenbacteria bacterium]|nr:phosphotransferase [Candidatus Andersenbacteria bacterium]
MKEKSNLEIWGEEIAKENNFVIDEKIYQGDYYIASKVRNIIFSGSYKNKSAVLKIYDDPRLTDEPISLENFNKQNKSRILKAPKLYDYQIISLQKGWLIMEKLPDGEFSQSPLNKNEKKEFLDVYLEYRQNFSEMPSRKLTLTENLPANKFHLFRINRWLELADKKEAEEIILKNNKPILIPDEFIPRLEKGCEIIDREFSKRKMIWCHGHFKPKEIFKVKNKGLYYLIDFAHSKMYPESYELAFMVWADCMLGEDYQKEYPEWKKGIDEWLIEFERINNNFLKIDNFSPLIKASLIERILGTILADIAASDRPKKEKRKRIDLLYQLFDELIKSNSLIC